MAVESESRKEIIPPHKVGAKKDIDVDVTTADGNDAKKLFMIARNRLMNVNHWHDFSGGLSATFHLTDANGNHLDRTAEKGDYFKIDLPGVGSAEGRGYDWVRIEEIEDISRPDGDEERIAIRVRPTTDPTTPGENVAHFFSDDATSSFIIERKGNEVTAGVHGRNEVPNTETSNLLDKIRNAVVGTSAILGFSNIQWKKLVKGLVTT